MGRAFGIDLGGTKIEVSVFDENWQPTHTRRLPTPHDSYSGLVAAVVSQAHWAIKQSGHKNPVIGVGIPGVQNSQTGMVNTPNIPASGHPFCDDLSKGIGQKVTFGNDGDLFTYSEAVLGAGQGYGTVFGLILGTGIGGGISRNGTMLKTLNGGAGEVGHVPVSAALVQEFDLPVLQCGCGRLGCYETLASGPGMMRLAESVIGKAVSSADIAAQAAAGDGGAQRVMDIWVRILAELIGTIQRTIDPDCIVLGGGLTKIPDITGKILTGLERTLLRGSTPPDIVLAKYGDSSGTRGAALAALTQGKGGG